MILEIKVFKMGLNVDIKILGFIDCLLGFK